MILRLTVTARLLIEEIGTYFTENQVINKIMLVPEDGHDEMEGIQPIVLNAVCQVSSIIAKHSCNTFRYSLRAN